MQRAREFSLFLKTARIAEPGCDEGISFGLPACGPVVPTAGSHNSSALLFFFPVFFFSLLVFSLKGLRAGSEQGEGIVLKPLLLDTEFMNVFCVYVFVHAYGCFGRYLTLAHPHVGAEDENCSAIIIYCTGYFGVCLCDGVKRSFCPKETERG